MQHLNAGFNAGADTWASAIALWDQGPCELKIGWGSNPILTNLVWAHPWNIHTNFEANLCGGLREIVKKVKSL